MIFLFLSFFSRGWLDNPNVLPDTDIVSNSVVVKPADPLLADKLAVGHKAVDAGMSEKSDEPLYDILSFFLPNWNCPVCPKG